MKREEIERVEEREQRRREVVEGDNARETTPKETSHSTRGSRQREASKPMS
ncbi:hypothetical protein GBA52_026521 [Prunus armeniaca]|nr:hypothetical protein GBA52_026521 [Prunus armeniaca]